MTASDTFPADVLIAGSKVIALLTTGAGGPTAGETIDARGCYVIPGGHRRAHPPRHAVRRHDVDRRLRRSTCWSRAPSPGGRRPILHALTRPEAAEATGTERAIALAEMAGVPVYIVHLPT